MLDHINMYMHPQAILVDSTNTEEDYFLRGIRDQVRATRIALIELPAQPSTRVAWISKLDSSALSGESTHRNGEKNASNVFLFKPGTRFTSTF